MTDDELEARVAAVEKRVQAAEDIEALKQLQRRYIRMLVNGEFDYLPSFYTEDAVLDLRAHGPKQGDALVQHLLDMHKNAPPAAGAILSSPVVTVDGDEGEAEWTWHRLLCEFPTQGGNIRIWGPWVETRYRLRYRRTADGWKICHAWMRAVMPDPDPGVPTRRQTVPGST